jgi:hypothetical protein
MKAKSRIQLSNKEEVGNGPEPQKCVFNISLQETLFPDSFIIISIISLMPFVHIYHAKTTKQLTSIYSFQSPKKKSLKKNSAKPDTAR